MRGLGIIALMTTLLWAPLVTSGEGLTVQDAWVRASPPGVDKAAAYFRIRLSEGAPNDRLVGVVSPDRGQASLHATVSTEAGTSMKSLDGVALAAGETVLFEPGGRHVMVTELDNRLEAGDRLELVLRFERRGERVVEVPVRPLSASGP